MLSKRDLSDKFSFPAYSSEVSNNGIIGYTNLPEFICDKNSPIFVVFGDHTKALNIVEKNFSVLDNVKVLKPIVNKKNSLLFILSMWQKHIPNLGYARHWKVAKNCIVPLPTKNNSIDFDFMENFIAELEADRIAELEAYLLATGLKDYTLTKGEEKALADFKNDKITFGKFTYQSIFNRIVQGRRLKKDDQLEGVIPFVMAGTTNTGVVNYISNPIASFPKNSITIDIFGNTFYRNYAFGAGDDTGVYWSDEHEYSKEAMLFFATAMEKSISGKFSYGKKLRSSQSFEFKLALPTSSSQPDYDLMSTLISAIQKLVIRDVVMYADKKIATTKKVVTAK